ncbi:DUF1801 domain-containing protein [Aminobacter sp. Piv2-1]|uniref:DUF1801 domain-containing protein n=1 Tax=Aminobacter sp. Piv2-1 TaxID=3031122 RepID=UPI0030A44B34
MLKEVPAANPQAYVEALGGWRREVVEALRAAVRAAGDPEARIKWGHIVCFSNGPVLLIRAEDARVLFGFWRGKRLRAIEPRLKAGGKYELATMTFLEGDTVDVPLAERLVREAVRLNAEVGDPTKSS